jgi:HAD superfamily hydrolase (TIGR01509 family)
MPHLTKPTAIVFDWFQTLVEIDVDAPEADVVIREAGYSCSREIAAIWLPEAFDGHATPVVYGGAYLGWRKDRLAELLNWCGVPQREQDELVSRILACDMQWTVRARPGALELLGRIRSSGYLTGICSNWDYPLEPYLEAAGFEELVDAHVVSCEVGYRKPHVQIFQAICCKLGVEPSEVLFCGDQWSTDVAGAIKAGLQALWLTGVPSPHPAIQTIESLESFLIDFENFLP